jgi:hypothetical protein
LAPGSGLEPGDLALIVATPDDLPQDRAKRVHGMTVVLIEICGCERCNYYSDKKPYWRVSGIPYEHDVHAVGHRALRKIPPAPMESSDEDWLPLVIPTLTDEVA